MRKIPVFRDLQSYPKGPKPSNAKFFHSVYDKNCYYFSNLHLYVLFQLSIPPQFGENWFLDSFPVIHFPFYILKAHPSYGLAHSFHWCKDIKRRWDAPKKTLLANNSCHREEADQANHACKQQKVKMQNQGCGRQHRSDSSL